MWDIITMSNNCFIVEYIFPVNGKVEFWAAVTPVLNVTWSFRNYWYTFFLIWSSDLFLLSILINSCLFNIFCANHNTYSLMKRNVIALINLNKLYTSEVMNYFKLIMDFSVLISKTCKHFVLLVQQIICFSRCKSVCDKNIHINWAVLYGTTTAFIVIQAFLFNFFLL